MPSTVTPFSRVRTLRILIGFVWQSSPRLVSLLLALTVLDGVLPLINILLNSRLLDILAASILKPDTVSKLLQDAVLLLCGLGIIAVLTALVGHGSAVVQRLFQIRASHHVQGLLALQATAVDLESFEDPKFHNLLQNAAQEAAFRPAMIAQLLMQMGMGFISLFSFAIVLAAWNAWVLLPIAAVSFTVYAVHRSQSGRATEMKQKITEVERRGQYLRTILLGEFAAKELRLFGTSSYIWGRLMSTWRQVYHEEKLYLRGRFLFVGVATAFLALAYPSFLGYLVWLVLAHSLTLGGFGLYSQSMNRVQESANRLLISTAQFNEHMLFVKYLTDFLELQPSIEAPRAHDARLSGASMKIEFDSVSFTYPGTQKCILKNVSFSVLPGETIALVGTNGSGKSTIVKLIAGLYEPTSGRILINGIDIRALDRKALRAKLAFVLQDFQVYHLSARENVGFGRIDSVNDLGAIRAAAKRTGLDEVIREFHHGYDTVLGRFFDRGQELSGGQRQLVALARAILRDAPVLIVDEPTAALDVHREAQFYHEVFTAGGNRGKSLILVSHRLSATKLADRIVVLNNGEIIEQGRHSELVAMNGYYAELSKVYDKVTSMAV